MLVVKIDEAARITLPPEIRQALHLTPGDELGLTIGHGRLGLSPAVSAEQRALAWQRIEAARAGVRPTPAQAAKSPEVRDAEINAVVRDAEINAVVREVRRELAAERRRR